LTGSATNANATPAQDITSEPGMLELLVPVALHWRSVVVVPLVAGCLGFAGSYLITPVFTSSTTFLPPQQQQSSAASALASLGNVAGLAAGAAGIKNPADQYVSLMESANVSDRIIAQFNLRSVYDLEYQISTRKELAKRVQIAVGKKDGLITVSVDDADGERAAAIANQYVHELRRMTAELAVTEAQQRRVFFEQQLAQSKERLAAAQGALQASGFNSGALRAEPKAAAESYAALRAELTSAEVRLQTLSRARADSSVEVQQQSGLVHALRDQLSSLEAASATHSGSPDYISKYREFKYQESLFDLLARQYEMARVDESREGALIQVVDVATVPERKSRPQRAVVAIMTATLTGFCFALFLMIRGRFRLMRARNPASAARFDALKQALRDH
jgi:uncharacterized protein involved in exopolysaccharide biosynthesis